MKNLKTALALLTLLAFPILSHAQISAPRMINFQGVLVDEGGNVLYDIQEADVRFSIIDGAGGVLYEEIQHVPIINGAISVLVGNGNNPNTGAITSGIPYDVFTAEGSKILRVRLEEHPIPQEDVQIVSVPYAYQAQYAAELTSPIESDNILDGTIQQIDLSEDLLSYIESSIAGVSESDLLSHRTESGAHTATSISVENTFVNAPGTNLQQILQGLDNAISIRGNTGEVLSDRLTQEISDREAADTTLQANINAEAATRFSADNTLQVNIDAEASAREVADNTHANTDIALAHPNGDFPTSRLSGEITSAQIANNSITTDDIQNETITTSDMASTNISQWLNDSGYITDGNQGWENTYGFITDGNQGWNNTYGFITDGNQGWNNTYGFITDGNQGWNNTYGFITASDDITGNAATATNADMVDGYHLNQDVRTNASPRFGRLVVDGNVGIGTTSPGAKLHVNDGGFRHGHPGEINIDAFGVIGGRFKILDNGNVGIGTTRPSAKLDVNGRMRVYGRTDIVGNLYVQGEIRGKMFYTDEYSWCQDNSATQMIPAINGFCFLTAVSGDFEGGGELVQVYIGGDNFWYLSGTAGAGRVAICGKARCVGNPATFVGF